MLLADRAAVCRASQLVTGGAPGCFFFFSSLSPNLTYNCHCSDCRAITHTCLQGTIDVPLVVKSQKPPRRHLIAKHLLCSVNLSLSTNLSLIIGSWHLWRDWKRGLGGTGLELGVKCLVFKEPIYNDSQHGGSLLTFIYEESPVHQRRDSSV